MGLLCYFTAQAMAESWNTVLVCEGKLPEVEEEGVNGWITLGFALGGVAFDIAYLPPYDMVGCAEGVGKKIMLRGIWDAELFNREGEMVPPLKDRGRGLYIPVPVVHPDMPVWSAFLSPQKSREEKVTSLIPTLPVRSYTRFRPKKVLADMPQFLWDLVREDAAGQGLWDEIDEEEAQFLATEQAEQAQLRGLGSKESGSSGSRPASRPATQQSGRPGTQQSAGRPATQQSASGSRPATQQSARPGTQGTQHSVSSSLAARTNVAAAPPSPTARPSPHQTLTEQSANLPRMELSAPATPVATGLPGEGFPGSPGSARASLLNEETLQERHAHAHVPHMGETRKVEELLADDRFLDSLAGKLANRLGGAGIQGTQTLRPSGAHGGPGSLSSFQPTMKRPEPVAFAEPAEGTKAALPRALQAGGGVAVDKSGKNLQRNDNEVHMTNMDVNAFTQDLGWGSFAPER
eukprot:g13665.t1